MSSYALPKTAQTAALPQRELEDRAWRTNGGSGINSRHAHAHGNGNGNSGGGSGPGQLVQGIQDKLGDMFGEQCRGDELPMYKDKPFSYAASRRRKLPLWRRRRAWAILALGGFLLFYMMGWLPGGGAAQQDGHRSRRRKGWFDWSSDGPSIWDTRRDEVRQAFVHSWDAYERYAWGYDAYAPVSKTGSQKTPNGMGFVIVDAMDSLMIMNLTSRLTKARQWVATKLDYSQDFELNVFEATSRLLGGLLSAYYLSTTYPDMAPLTDDDEGADGEDLYLEKAKDLIDRMVGAYESDSGIPTVSVNLRTMRGSLSGGKDGTSSSAEVGSLQLESKYMSKVTGEAFYWQQAEKVIARIEENRLQDGLVPARLDPVSGMFRGDSIRYGTRGTSFYEGLLKQYLQTSKEEPVYEELWREAVEGIRKHLLSYSTSSRFTVIGERPNGIDGSLSARMEHSSCSLAGALALSTTGGEAAYHQHVRDAWSTEQQLDLELAQELMKTCWAMNRLTATTLAPEAVHFSTTGDLKGTPFAPDPLDDATDAVWKADMTIPQGEEHNTLQAQTAESLFYLWRVTGDERYRDWGWDLFQAFVQHAGVEENGGFTALLNANIIPAVKADNMERFWLSETLKYLYLLFSPDDLLPLDQIVINSAGHIFPRFKLAPLFSTGWKRKSIANSNTASTKRTMAVE